MKHLIKDNQIIQSVMSIPSIFTRPSGEIFWGGYSERTELHYLDGWRDEILPEYNTATQSLGERYYDQAIDKVTYRVVEKEIPALATLKELKVAELKEIANNLLKITDWVVIRKYERNIEIPLDVQNNRQSIIDRCNLKEAAILYLTDETSVITFDISL
ncbi:hypothetical protein ACRTDU_03840 [Sunxiuqinia elliptica]